MEATAAGARSERRGLWKLKRRPEPASSFDYFSDTLEFGDLGKRRSAEGLMEGA